MSNNSKKHNEIIFKHLTLLCNELGIDAAFKMDGTEIEVRVRSTNESPSIVLKSLLHAFDMFIDVILIIHLSGSYKNQELEGLPALSQFMTDIIEIKILRCGAAILERNHNG